MYTITVSYETSHSTHSYCIHLLISQYVSNFAYEEKCMNKLFTVYVTSAVLILALL
jgi:hypothetical protein